jgi:hypothetical protein
MPALYSATALQLKEVGVGLEVRIGLGHREQLAQCAGQHVLGLDPLVHGAGVGDGGAGVSHRLERAALVRGIALHRLDQVGDEVAALLQLHVDVSEGLVDVLPQPDQPVVDPHQHEDQDDNDTNDDEGDDHGSPRGSTAKLVEEIGGRKRKRETLPAQADKV